MSLKSPPSLAISHNITSFPRELHLNILTFLRATDLSALQCTSRCFNHRDLIVAVVDHCANVVYPSDLTKGFDTPIISGEVRSVAVVAKKGNKNANPDDTPNTTATAAATPEKVYTYEMLRNMEMLVVARVLSRPEPPLHERDTCFYVSKSWCRAALRWLEVQEEEWKEQEERRRAVVEEARVAAQSAAITPKKGRGNKFNGGSNGNRKSPHPGSSGKKKKLSRKEQRQRDRRMSDAMPPWSNINNDIVCEHGSVKQCSSKSARARRRVMDKQAWKVLKRLYPESVQLEASSNSSLGNNNNDGINSGGCLLCAAETETAKKAELDRKEGEKVNRKKPLGCPLVRGFYTRGSKGYPISSCVDNSASITGLGMSSTATATRSCPLKPGVYCALPRSWCHRWRKYIKTGEGGLPPAPDASEVLCDAHNLPLVPPHVESFLCGETLTLLGSNHATTAAAVNVDESVASVPVAAAAAPQNRSARANPDAETLQALRAAGISEAELHAQRVAMAVIEEDMRHFSIHDVPHPIIHESTAVGGELQQDRVVTNEQLDRENRVVVEILTEEEVNALEKWWPRCHSDMYALRFAVVEIGSARNGNASNGGTEILWSTMPCRECDPSSRSTANFVVRNRLQKRGYR